MEETILKAAEQLKLHRPASIREIQQRYRQLVKEHHPDRQPGTPDAEMAQINTAYAILIDYCQNYKIRFDQEPPKEEPRDWWKEQFGHVM